MDVDGNEGDVLGLAGSIWQDDGNAAASDSLPAQEEEDEDEEDVCEDDYNPMVMVDGEEMPFYAGRRGRSAADDRRRTRGVCRSLAEALQKGRETGADSERAREGRD